MPIVEKKLQAIPCTTLSGVGPRVAERLAKLDIHTLQDLLFHLPMRYVDRTRITPMQQIKIGEHAVVEGVVIHSEIVVNKRRVLRCHLSDGAGRIAIAFFHYTAAQQKQFRQENMRLRCYGEVRWGQIGPEIIHPEYTIIKDDSESTLDQHLTPVYHTTEGLHQNLFRKLMDQAIKQLEAGGLLTELLPDELREQETLCSLQQAIIYMHRPPPDADQALIEKGEHPYQARLIVEELLAHQLSLLQLRSATKKYHAPSLTFSNELVKPFLNALPFSLTAAQQRVVQEISEDIKQKAPMLRLVQGDVGAGKTLVAAMAALCALESNYQVALMAPTELLSEQHLHNFKQWLSPLGIHVVWLCGKQTAKQRRSVLEDIALGHANLVVGTHALFQDSVVFKKLALIIVDEQHRFGVHQRLALREKGVSQSGSAPHQLIMTATPIPRTLAMTAYADLDCSVIDELPPGRTPVSTVAIANQRRDDVVTRLRMCCQQGRQAYWVCTLIEESDVLQCQAAEAAHAYLQEQLPELTICLVHGRMSGEEKQLAMVQFKAGAIDVLVATTVIEVGVDVPNASLMIIENAERLGLSQLHQLRGRVGRGHQESHCVLMYQSPLSQLARQRLDILRETTDGFLIAERDLEIRGPGEVLGTRQTGLMHLRVADLTRDAYLLPRIQQVSASLINNYPEVVPKIIHRWIGSNAKYGRV